MKSLSVWEMAQIGRAAVEQFDEEFDHIGVRIQDHPEEVGSQMTHQSHVWYDGEDTGELLPGVSAINAKDKYLTPNTPGRYLGKYVLILGSYRVQWGTDTGEIIMIDPVVLDCRPLDQVLP